MGTTRDGGVEVESDAFPDVALVLFLLVEPVLRKQQAVDGGLGYNCLGLEILAEPKDAAAREVADVDELV